jgi:hypothetical protein
MFQSKGNFMATETIRTGLDLPAAFRRISWSAVFAGVVVTIMVALLLNLLGIGIGLMTINPTTQADPMSGLGIGAAIWWVVSSLIALFAGGCVAGRLSGVTRPYDATLHGVLTWGLVTLVSFFLLTTALGSLIGGAGNLIGRGIAGVEPRQVTQTAQQEHGDIQHALAMAQIRAEANVLFEGDVAEARTGAPAWELRRDLNQALGQMFSQGMVNDAERPRVVELVVVATGSSPQEVEQLVNRWSQMYEEGRVRFEAAGTGLEQRVAQAGERAAKGAGTAALVLFVGLVLGGLAAAFGGRVGIPKDLVLKEAP